MSKTYYARPSAKAARRAWDWFVANNDRPPKELYYTPHYDFCQKGWIMEWNFKNEKEFIMAYSSLTRLSATSAMSSFKPSSELY